MTVFVDTFALIAWLNPRDDAHVIVAIQPGHDRMRFPTGRKCMAAASVAIAAELKARKAPPTVETKKDQARLALDDPSLYINRELSWLEFNRRVLEEAQDPQVPLLERLKFLAIFSSNLDEFFMVRVGGLQQKVSAGIIRGSGADRMPPREQLERISQTVRQRVAEQYRCLMGEVLPALEAEGVVIRGVKDLSDADRRHVF